MGRLFLRIFLWFWLGTTSLLVVLTLGFLIVQPDVMAQWRTVGRGAMQSLGVQAANTYEREGASSTASMVARFAQVGDLHVWLYPRDRGPLGSEPPAVGAEDVVHRAFLEQEAESAPSGGMILLARRVESDSRKPYVIVWQAPVRFTRASVRRFFSVRILALILTGGMVCLWLTWQITRPIRALRSATRRFSQGELTVRVGDNQALRRGDELSELARDFDLMASRIQSLIKAQQQLLADISHELRSPLARVSLALDLARRRLGEGVPEHQRIEREVQRLNELIEQLLTLARLEAERGNAGNERVDLRELTREIAEDARFEGQAKNKQVIVHSECDAVILGSPALLRSAIENVVRNAVRHAPEGSEVTIHMKRLDETARVVIAVRDHGPGVPPQTLACLFDPFFRVEEGRERISGGVGLGLSIVRQAMLFHGGSATAENDPEGGLLVRLEFPVK